MNGQITRIDHGDFYARKGIGYCSVQINPTTNVGIFITHTIADYDTNYYFPDRLAQACVLFYLYIIRFVFFSSTSQIWELSQLIKMISRQTGNSSHHSLVIVAGDLNSVPHSLEYHLLLTNALLRDSFEDTNAQGRGRTPVSIKSNQTCQHLLR